MNISLLLLAIACVESDCNPQAYNEAEDAAGILQIRPIMVEDCNRIVGEERWKPEDRYDIIQSYEMAIIYLNNYCFGMSLEEMARCWNGGPSGYKKNATLAYWHKVEKELIRLMEEKNND